MWSSELIKLDQFNRFSNLCETSEIDKYLWTAAVT